MASFQIFGSGFVMMLLCISLGIVMAFGGGILIDSLTLGKTGETLLNNTEITPKWQTSQDNTVYFFINLYYFICYSLPLLGIVIFIQSILPKTTGDRYT